MSEPEPLEIRSFRSVFDLERRVYRIDRFRLNPSGVPLRGIVYLIGLVVLARVLDALPLVGALLRMVPWWGRDLLAPTVVAAVLAVLRIEGRPAHLAVRSLVAHAASPHHLTGLQPCAPLRRGWVPASLTLIADGSEGTPRRLRYRGPGAVLVHGGHVREECRRGVLGRALRRPDVRVGLSASGGSGEGAVVVRLAAGTQLEVGPVTVARSTPGARAAPTRASRWW
jgi:hypothetical protein